MKINYINELVQEIKNAKTDVEIVNILENLCKPIIQMKDALIKDVLPNDEVTDPYDIDLSYNGISIYKSWYDFKEDELDQEKVYHIGYEEFFRMMFNIPVKRT